MRKFPRFRWLPVLGLAVPVLLVLYGGWLWFVERVEVPTSKYLVRIHYWGKNLPEGELMAPDETYKGVMLDVHAEGRYFFNPLFWSTEIHDLVTVPPDQCLVLMRKYGTEIPKDRLTAGDFLARPDASKEALPEKGIVREVLLPGSHRINPHAYSWKMEPAVQVRANQVGVKTLKVGLDPKELGDKDPLRSVYVVPNGYRGVQQETVPSATYYLNPWVETITPVDVQSHRVEFTDITFPSRDGFILKPHMVVEYAVKADKAAEVLVRLSDHGLLHQADANSEEMKNNEILQKVVLPHIRGFARIEGSNFDAKDFIITSAGAPDKKVMNNREKLQKALEDKVKPRCAELGIVVRAVTLANMDPPPELSKLISEREQAVVEQDKNKSRLGQYKSEQELRAKEALSQQNEELTKAGTRKKQEETRAKQRTEVEEQRLKQDLENAQLRLDASRRDGEAILSKGKADAAVINLQNEAEVAGLRKAVQGFNGVQNFAQFHVLMRLAPALTEVFAAEDSEFAKLLTIYLRPPTGANKAAAGGAPAVEPEKTATPSGR